MEYYILNTARLRGTPGLHSDIRVAGRRVVPGKRTYFSAADIESDFTNIAKLLGDSLIDVREAGSGKPADLSAFTTRLQATTARMKVIPEPEKTTSDPEPEPESDTPVSRDASGVPTLDEILKMADDRCPGGADQRPVRRLVTIQAKHEEDVYQ